MSTIALVGPLHPHRGGIAQYGTLLHRELAPHHEVRAFSYSRLYPDIIFPGKTQLDESARAIEVPCDPCIDAIDPFSWFAAANKIDAANPDLTAIMWWQPALAPALGTIARRLAARGRRMVYICHNVVPHEGAKVSRWLSAWAFAPVSRYICHAQAEVPELLHLRAGAEVRVNPLPTFDQYAPTSPVSPEAARKQLGLKGSKVLLFFGLIRPYKGVKVLIEAFRQLAGDPEYELVIAGESYEAAGEYEKLIAQTGHADRIRFLNRFVANEEVAPYFAAADVVVLPYLTASQSAVLQIAYALDRPVIATRVGGLPEVVFEGETGYLVPPGDAGAIAAAVRDFYARGGRAAFAEGIRRRADVFAWSRIRALLEGFVDRG